MEPLIAEKELVRQIIDGEQVALLQFYEQFADPTFAYILHLMDGQRQDAEDVWQETLLAAINSLSSYRGDSRLFTWICAIARLKTAAFYRRQGHVFPASEPVSLGELETLLDQQPLPEHILQQREVRCRVVNSLQELSPDYRQALLARYVEERSVEDIARHLGRSYKAAESLLSRARSEFQKIFFKLGD